MKRCAMLCGLKMKTDNWRNAGQRERKSWEETAVALAKAIAALRSPDPYVQVGACGIKYNGEFILGYNGPPSGVDVDWRDRDGRRKYMLHAEYNVLKRVNASELKILAVTHLPCEPCMLKIADKKVNKVYYNEDHATETYGYEGRLELAESLGIELVKL